MKFLTATQVLERFFNFVKSLKQDPMNETWDRDAIEEALQEAQNGNFSVAILAARYAYFLCRALPFSAYNEKIAAISVRTFLKQNGFTTDRSLPPLFDVADNQTSLEELIKWFAEHVMKIQNESISEILSKDSTLVEAPARRPVSTIDLRSEIGGYEWESDKPDRDREAVKKAEEHWKHMEASGYWTRGGAYGRVRALVAGKVWGFDWKGNPITGDYHQISDAPVKYEIRFEVCSDHRSRKHGWGLLLQIVTRVYAPGKFTYNGRTSHCSHSIWNDKKVHFPNSKVPETWPGMVAMIPPSVDPEYRQKANELFAEAYHEFIKELIPAPPEMEDMHTMYNYNESSEGWVHLINLNNYGPPDFQRWLEKVNSYGDGYLANHREDDKYFFQWRGETKVQNLLLKVIIEHATKGDLGKVKGEGWQVRIICSFVRKDAKDTIWDATKIVSGPSSEIPPLAVDINKIYIRSVPKKSHRQFFITHAGKYNAAYEKIYDAMQSVVEPEDMHTMWGYNESADTVADAFEKVKSWVQANWRKLKFKVRNSKLPGQDRLDIHFTDDLRILMSKTEGGFSMGVTFPTHSAKEPTDTTWIKVDLDRVNNFDEFLKLAAKTEQDPAKWGNKRARVCRTLEHFPEIIPQYPVVKHTFDTIMGLLFAPPEMEDMHAVWDYNERKVIAQDLELLEARPSKETEPYKAFKRVSGSKSGKPNKKLEPLIATEARASYFYATCVVNGRFPEGEPALLQNANYAVSYARHILHERWPEAEPTILSGKCLNSNGTIDITLAPAINYAEDVIKGRWPELEHVLLTPRQTGVTHGGVGQKFNAYDIMSYAVHVVKDRWIEGEPILAEQGGYLAYHYASKAFDITEEEAEKVIKSPVFKEKGFNTFEVVEPEEMHTMWDYNEANIWIDTARIIESI